MDDRSPARPEAALLRRATKPNKPPRPAAGAGMAPPSPPVVLLEPTILLVGADAAFEPALRAALARHGVYVETTSADDVLETVIAAAPDLVLLVGPAARDGGRELLERLTSVAASSVIPIALLDDNAALDVRLRAFRHGAAAVIQATASIDTIADRIAKLARDIPERESESLGVIGEATLSEFVGALENELRSGILSVQTGNREDDAVRLVLGKGRPLAAFIDDFVRQVKSHVLHAEPLRYEFAEHAGGTLALLDPNAPAVPDEAPSLEGLRVVLADDDTGRADSVAQELRARGVWVVVTDLNPSESRFTKLRQIDPQLLLIGESHVQGRGYELLRRMRRDTRLRWVSLLVVRWHELWSDSLSVPGLDRLAFAVASLCEADRALESRAGQGMTFDARLEATGPARCLRALTSSRRALQVSVTNPRARFSIDLSDGLVVGASGEPTQGGAQWHGALALSAFMVLSSGRVHVALRAAPAATNVMATVDVALSMADEEPSPILPSVPVLPADERVPSDIPTSTRGSALRSAAQALARAVFSPAQPGVSVPAAALLVGLAILQGIVVVAVPRWVSRLHSNARPAPELSATRPLPSLQSNQAAPLATRAASANVAPAAPGDGSEHPLATAQGLPTLRFTAPKCEDVLGPLGAHAAEQPNAAFDAMQEAHRALVRGDLNATERALCQAVLWNRTNAAIPLELAQLMLLRRDAQQAASWAARSLELEPDSSRAEGVLGDALACLGQYSEAKSAWYKSLRLDPALQGPQKELSYGSLREAKASMKRHDVARAERLFRRAAVFDPDNATASNGLSEVLLRLGDTVSARYWAKHWVEIAPRDASARVMLGDILARSGDVQGAEAAFREALQIEPTHYPAQQRLERLGRTHSAPP